MLLYIVYAIIKCGIYCILSFIGLVVVHATSAETISWKLEDPFPDGLFLVVEF